MRPLPLAFEHEREQDRSLRAVGIEGDGHARCLRGAREIPLPQVAPCALGPGLFVRRIEFGRSRERVPRRALFRLGGSGDSLHAPERAEARPELGAVGVVPDGLTVSRHRRIELPFRLENDSPEVGGVCLAGNEAPLDAVAADDAGDRVAPRAAGGEEHDDEEYAGAALHERAGVLGFQFFRRFGA